MSEINISQAISTHVMSWNSPTRTLAAEASDVHYTKPYRLYNDACDFGLWVRSHRTNKLVPFIFDGTDEDREGDTLCWRFTGWDNGEAIAHLVIFND